jgi:hypothetical protein
MYAMSRFDSRLFPPTEAERFAAELFSEGTEGESLTGEGGNEIREYIITLYRRFLSEGEKDEDWKAPLLAFLNELPKK